MSLIQFSDCLRAPHPTASSCCPSECCVSQPFTPFVCDCRACRSEEASSHDGEPQEKTDDAGGKAEVGGAEVASCAQNFSVVQPHVKTVRAELAVGYPGSHSHV